VAQHDVSDGDEGLAGRVESVGEVVLIVGEVVLDRDGTNSSVTLTKVSAELTAYPVR